MPKFNSGDICKIVDIGKEDTYFPQKDELIGKKVEFRWYNVSPNYREQDGFFSCMAYICDEYETGSIRKAIYFYRVKLKKVV